MSQFISLPLAQSMIAGFKKSRTELINSGAIGTDFLPLSEKFDAAQIRILLAKPDCQALRIYLGAENGEVKAMLVAVNSADQDIIAGVNETNALGEPEDILERGYRCPPQCPTTSPLNS